MTWSIERLDEGYGLVETNGETSRTVAIYRLAKDAKKTVQAYEVYELFQNGAPVEVVKVKRKGAK